MGILGCFDACSVVQKHAQMPKCRNRQGKNGGKVGRNLQKSAFWSVCGVDAERVVRELSADVVLVIAVSAVLYFQRAGIQYINSSAGKQVRIAII